MRILPYLNPYCGVLTARFSNLTKFKCSHRRDIITYTHDIFNNRCKRPHYSTPKISNLYIENEYHQLTSQKKSDYFWTRVDISTHWRLIFFITLKHLNTWDTHSYLFWIYLIRKRAISIFYKSSGLDERLIYQTTFYKWADEVLRGLAAFIEQYILNTGSSLVAINLAIHNIVHSRSMLV